MNIIPVAKGGLPHTPGEFTSPVWHPAQVSFAALAAGAIESSPLQYALCLPSQTIGAARPSLCAADPWPTQCPHVSTAATRLPVVDVSAGHQRLLISLSGQLVGLHFLPLVVGTRHSSHTQPTSCEPQRGATAQVGASHHRGHLPAGCLATAEVASVPLAGVPECLRTGLQILHQHPMGSGHGAAPALELRAQEPIAENKIKGSCRGVQW